MPPGARFSKLDLFSFIIRGAYDAPGGAPMKRRYWRMISGDGLIATPSRSISRTIHMADAEQVDLIRQGPEAWNEWRRTHPGRQIDLSGARLDEVKLEEIDLSGAKLDGIRLRWGYLRRANLRGASAIQADLRIVDLSKADCREANFEGSRLQGAYLRQGQF
jgi:hypothetical protein